MRNQTIRTRLSLGYSLLILLVLFSVSAVISLVFSDYLKKASLREARNRMGNIEESVQSSLFSVVSLCDELRNEEIVVDALNAAGPDEIIYRNLIQMHQQAIGSNLTISRMVLINRNLEILDPVYSRYLYSEAILADEDFGEFLQGRYSYYFSRPGIFPIDLETREGFQSPTIVLYQRLYDNNFWLLGYLLAVLEKNSLFSSVWENNRDDYFEGLAFFNTRGALIYREGAAFGQEDLNIDFSGLREDYVYTEATGFGSLPKGRYLACIKPLDGVNWFFVGIVSNRTIMADREILMRTIYFLGLFFLLLSILLSYFLARTITRPLFSITAAMHRYEKSKVPEKIDVEPGGELGYLVDRYNKLVESISRYIQDIYAEQEKKQEAELRSLHYELDYLQAQINPHFIHNTLNALGYQAEKEGNTQLFESLKAFNTLLRAVLSGIDECISLDREMILTGYFVRILKFRYGDGFDFIDSIRLEDRGCRVPKLLLQPLVENAIFHGIEPLEDRRGCIEIVSGGGEDFLEIEVRDNGIGMDDNPLSSASHPRNFNSIGMHNVDERLKILFGEDSGLSVVSEKDGGCVVRIILPREKDVP